MSKIKLPHVSYYLPANRQRWRISFSIDGRRYYAEGGLDEEATRRIAVGISQKMELYRTGQITAAEITGWRAERKPLNQHIADWTRELAIHDTPVHVETCRQRVTDLLELAKVKSLNSIRPEAIRAALTKMRVAGKSAQTLNHYIQAVTQFTRWCAHPERRRIEQDPLDRRLTRYNVRVDRRRRRRALTVAEVESLIAAVEAAQWRRGERRERDGSVVLREMHPVDRALLYRVAVETGLRAGELRALTVGQWTLTGDKTRVTYRAEDDKAGRGGSLPVRKALAAQLRTVWQHRDRGAKCFPGMPAKPVRMFRRDLARAGIPYHTDEGTADFHALRHTCASWLASRGVLPKVIQTLMRHSDMKLTEGVYVHAFDDDVRVAVEGFRGRNLAADLVAPLGQRKAKKGRKSAPDGPSNNTTDGGK